MKNIAVLASGYGSNLQAIINAIKNKKIKNAKIALVISDRADAYALVRAKKHSIPFLYINPEDYKYRTSYDCEVVKELQKHKIDLVVLAGFMRIISPCFIRAYHNKIINIHPALLPAFKGTDGIGDALSYGVKVTGVTVHFVDEKMDNGAIILQSAVLIKETDTKESLAKKIHKLEHKLFPRAIKLILEGKIRLCGRKVKVML